MKLLIIGAGGHGRCCLDIARSMNIYDDIAFSLKNLDIPYSEFDSRIDEALKKVNMLEYKNSSSFELSLGQKQKIAFSTYGSIIKQPSGIAVMTGI